MVKQLIVNEKYERLRQMKLPFCCANSYLLKDCKSERVCGVSGCTKKHNKLLHLDSPKTKTGKDKKSEESPSQNRGGSSSLLTAGGGGFLQLIPNSIGKKTR